MARKLYEKDIEAIKLAYHFYQWTIEITKPRWKKRGKTPSQVMFCKKMAKNYNVNHRTIRRIIGNVPIQPV